MLIPMSNSKRGGRTMNKKLLMMLLCILLLISTTTVFAYYSNYFEVSQPLAVNVNDGIPQIVTSTGSNQINVTVRNTGSAKMFARIKVLTPSTVTASYSSADGEINDGYFYYSSPIETNSNPIVVNLSTTRTDSYQSVVVVETTTAQYNEQGTAYADWTTTIE